ncbi:MAG: DUF5317 domain-containing protein [Actinomycetota bacterium]|nr:DUF5317 domain-containing protein [Actinomycetota bacterium]
MSWSIVVALVLAAVLARFRGGSFQLLADTRLRWTILLFEGLLIQVLFDIWDPPGLTRSGALAVLIVSNVAVAAFIALNARMPGLLLAGLGLLLNVVVITANQAMPVSDSAAKTAGVAPPPESSTELKHERLDTDTKLPWLADVIPVPGLGEILSAGDIFLALGIGRLVYAQMSPKSRGSRREAVTRDAASG